MSSNQSFHEKELLFRLEADDTSAFDALYYYYEPRLRLFLYPFTGADESLLNAILQDSVDQFSRVALPMFGCFQKSFC